MTGSIIPWISRTIAQAVSQRSKKDITHKVPSETHMTITYLVRWEQECKLAADRFPQYGQMECDREVRNALSNARTKSDSTTVATTTTVSHFRISSFISLACVARPTQRN